MTTAQEIKALEAQLKAMKANEPKVRQGRITVKVGEKGNVLIYGLQRFPVSLYANQIEKLKDLFNSADLAQFMQDNKEKLATKEIQ